MYGEKQMIGRVGIPFDENYELFAIPIVSFSTCEFERNTNMSKKKILGLTSDEHEVVCVHICRDTCS